MQSRKILFVLNNSSSQKSIMSEAETLGALKADMRRAGIDYENMTFFEGRTRTELKDDASVLPTNVPLPSKGTTPAGTTNDLVFMLTTANKKIRSGASDRPELYAKIKELNLQDECKKRFGKNFTQCGSDDLRAVIAGATEKPASQVATKKESKVKEPKVEVPVTEAPVAGNTTVAITNAGKNKMDVIKIIRDTIHVGLKESKDIVDGVPSKINGLTDEVAAKVVSELVGAGATASIETETPITGHVGPCVDVKARNILRRLLENLVTEESLDETCEYSTMLEELDEDAEIEEVESPKAIKEEPKKDEDTLSSSELNEMFGGWAK